MNHTLRSVVEEELQKAYERGVQDGIKQEHALRKLAKIGQEIERRPQAYAVIIEGGLFHDVRRHRYDAERSAIDTGKRFNIVPLYFSEEIYEQY